MPRRRITANEAVGEIGASTAQAFGEHDLAELLFNGHGSMNGAAGGIASGSSSYVSR
jgi:hypothetical protein